MQPLSINLAITRWQRNYPRITDTGQDWRFVDRVRTTGRRSQVINIELSDGKVFIAPAKQD